MNRPLIITGPPGSGKSHWIAAYGLQQGKQLLACPCRKDRTLREGRQKLHIWGRRREPVILWLEGADDLTPEAQAFLRRILETHSSDVQFVLECRDAGRLQEPIRSRCVLRRLSAPTEADLRSFCGKEGVDPQPLVDYLMPNEYSWRRFKQCIYLQTQNPALWAQVVEGRRRDRAAAADPHAALVPTYQLEAIHPEIFIEALLDQKDRLADYGECLEAAGSLWAFVASALPD